MRQWSAISSARGRSSAALGVKDCSSSNLARQEFAPWTSSASTQWNRKVASKGLRRVQTMARLREPLAGMPKTRRKAAGGDGRLRQRPQPPLEVAPRSWPPSAGTDQSMKAVTSRTARIVRRRRRERDPDATLRCDARGVTMCLVGSPEILEKVGFLKSQARPLRDATRDGSGHLQLHWVQGLARRLSPRLNADR